MSCSPEKLPADTDGGRSDVDKGAAATNMQTLQSAVGHE